MKPGIISIQITRKRTETTLMCCENARHPLNISSAPWEAQALRDVAREGRICRDTMINHPFRVERISLKALPLNSLSAVLRQRL